MFSLIVVADAGQARFLRVSGPLHARHIQELPHLVQPLAPGAPVAEGDAAKHGHYRTERSAAGRVEHFERTPHATNRDFDPDASGDARFAKKLAHEIDLLRQAGGVDDFTLLVAPHFLGLLRKQLADGTRKLVRLEVPGDYVHSDLKTILHAAYPS